MSDRPLVKVATPVCNGELMEGLLVVTCSACLDELDEDELTDWETDNQRGRRFLQRQAYLHAQEAHDGDVDREGWA
jgi:hypothetical protein